MVDMLTYQCIYFSYGSKSDISTIYSSLLPAVAELSVEYETQDLLL